MKTIHTILIASAIFIFAIFNMNFVLYTTPLIQIDLSLGSLFTILASFMIVSMFRTNSKGSNYLPKKRMFHIMEIPIDEYKNTIKSISINWKSLIPFIPLFFMAILLLAKPYYLFPTPGDLDFHLMRAREILENPFYGMFYDYMINYPIGRPVGHPPLFHSILATLWYLGGVRFAHSVLCLTQILLSIGIATWFARNKYGIIAGFFAGLFVFSVPRPDTLYVLMPATFIPILGLLTIYFMPKNRKKALITSLLGIWTHMIGIVLFPILFIANKKGREYLKDWKVSLLLFSSVTFWLAYWIYFTGHPCPCPVPSISLYTQTYLPGFILLSTFGIAGLVLLFKENKGEFNLFLAYFLTILMLQIWVGDISRGIQYSALPLAVLTGFFIQKSYKKINSNKKSLKTMFLLLMFFVGLGSGINFIHSPMLWVSDWNQNNVPFENKYHGLKEYLDDNTNQNQVLGANTTMALKIAWMSGRNVYNEEFGTTKRLNMHQDLNIQQYPDHFTIENRNNVTKKEIPF